MSVAFIIFWPGFALTLNSCSIQFAGAVALTNCPGAPRLQFLAGRPDAKFPSPPLLVPSPAGPVENILARMDDAGFTPDDTVALLAAHSLARQKNVDYSVVGLPLDSTPGIFDSQIYLEVSETLAYNFFLGVEFYFEFWIGFTERRTLPRYRPKYHEAS